MGDGTADGVQTPPQPGVITREGENFPIIPKHLLKLSPEEIQHRIERVALSRRLNQDSIFHNLELEGQLEDTQAVLEFTKTAVERQKASTERE
jgi:hypothetical protein